MGSLFLLFVATPLVELWLLMRLSQVIGTGWTIGIVLLTGAAGASLARREGLKTLQEAHLLSNQGVLPGDQVLDAVAIFLGGAFLLTPGIITDILGFCLLVPPTRKALKTLVGGWLKRRLKMHQVIIQQQPPKQGAASQQQGRVFDQHFDKGNGE